MKDDKHFEPVTPTLKDAKPFLLFALGVGFCGAAYFIVSEAPKHQLAEVPPVLTVDESAVPAALTPGSVAYVNTSGCQLVYVAPAPPKEGGGVAECVDVRWNEAQQQSVGEAADGSFIMQNWDTFAPKAN